MDKKKDKLLLLYLFQDTNLKEIDIYTLSKNILKLRHVIEMYTTSEQNKNENTTDTENENTLNTTNTTN
jgi:hypothetical protein